jgi:hypothetical protein
LKSQEFTDEALAELYDFVRCQRADGSYYGTSGQCRQGLKVGAKEKSLLKKAAKGGDERAAAALAVVEGKKTKAQANKELKAKSVPSKMKKELAALEPTKPAKDKKEPKKKESKQESDDDTAKAFRDRFTKSKKELGKGSYGAVKETAEGTVIKEGFIGKDEISVQQKLADIDGVPKLIGHTYTSEPFADRGGDRKGFVEMEKAKGQPVQRAVMNDRMDDKFTPAKATKLTDEYLGLRKQIHTRGVAHGDMHEGNITWDGNKMGVLDFGLSKPSYIAALNEALGTFGEKGGRWDPRAEGFLDDMKRDGANSARATKLQQKIESIQKKAGGSITEKRAQQLIEELYDGI